MQQETELGELSELHPQQAKSPSQPRPPACAWCFRVRNVSQLGERLGQRRMRLSCRGQNKNKTTMRCDAMRCDAPNDVGEDFYKWNKKEGARGPGTVGPRSLAAWFGEAVRYKVHWELGILRGSPVTHAAGDRCNEGKSWSKKSQGPRPIGFRKTSLKYSHLPLMDYCVPTCR